MDRISVQPRAMTLPATLLLAPVILLLASACAAPSGGADVEDGEVRSDGPSGADAGWEAGARSWMEGTQGNDLVPVEISAVGVDLQSGNPVVLLRETESGQLVPIWVGVAEAQAIGRALHGIETPRPMTHDLLAETVRRMGGTVQEVLVHDIQEGIYLGLIYVTRDGERDPVALDSRPSDAMALALRTGAVVRVNPDLLQDAEDLEFMSPEGEGQVVRALGITVGFATGDRIRELGLPDRDGVVVVDVSGAAEEAGLQRGDLIVDVNGTVPEEPMDFLEGLGHTPPGEPVRIVVWRDGEEQLLELVPGEEEGRQRVI